MNIYLVVEGAVSEKLVYSKWIKYLNDDYKIISSIDQVTENCVYIISGRGYPNYMEVIEDSAHDVCSNEKFDRLVVAIDSEDMELHEKYEEINNHIGNLNLEIDYRIIVQHFCLETWALGNKIIVKRNPQSDDLRNYINFFNVVSNDPELLPPYPDENLNRAQFSKKYLRSLLKERFRNLTYSERNPGALLHQKYYKRVKERFETTDHIQSFSSFLSAFI